MTAGGQGVQGKNEGGASRLRNLSELETPCLLLDRVKMAANIERMARRIEKLGCVLRPHVKTHKSVDVARMVVQAGATAGITVSTLKEARHFFDNGFKDILYAVGIAPNKLDVAAALIGAGCDLKLVLDSVEMARAVAVWAAGRGVRLKVLIELDVDGHRSGAAPEGEGLCDVARVLCEAPNIELMGVMTHAGASYRCRTPEALHAAAARERDGALLAARRLRAFGIDDPVVSIGSTPTALAADDLTGVSEVRAGVYAFFDLVMAGIGVCAVEDIAVSVLCSVIGRQEEKGQMITDGGWMALSRDRGTADQAVDYGYGRVADIEGRLIDDLVVVQANQEHGVIGALSGKAPAEQLALGSMVRVLPNHACATSAQYDRYVVVADGAVIAEWPRIGGWR